MLTQFGNLHLEIQTSRKSPVGILRTSFRDKASGQMLHTQHGRITGCSLDQLKMLQLAFRERVVPIDAPEAFRTTKNKEKKRYCLCRNPLTAESERQTRKRLIKLTEEGLQKIAAYQRKTTVEVLGARVGKLLAKYKVGKLFSWRVEADPQAASSRAHKLIWNLDQEKVTLEELLDGCYVVSADMEAGRMDKEQIVATYKALGNVERAFRNLKTVQLEMRPFYHKKDERIRAHAFLCTLAYYVQWHMVERLRPLFEDDGAGADRRWTVKNVIQRLAGIGRYLARVSDVEFHQTTDADEEQRAIIDLLRVMM